MWHIVAQMATNGIKRGKQAMDGLIRFRAPSLLTFRLKRIAEKRNKLETEVYREATVEFVERWEKLLKLPPMKAA